MIELFETIPVKVKNEIKLFINATLKNPSPIEAAKRLVEYRELLNEEEQDFLDFYINLKIVEQEDESNSNQW